MEEIKENSIKENISLDSIQIGLFEKSFNK